jgi:hypothetical protein
MINTLEISNRELAKMSSFARIAYINRKLSEAGFNLKKPMREDKIINSFKITYTQKDYSKK